MIYIYTIKGCPYCQRAIGLLKAKKIPYKNKIVATGEKAKYKAKHLMATFPQIFLKNSQGKMMRIGGLAELERVLD